jgi:hypothetical protein
MDILALSLPQPQRLAQCLRSLEDPGTLPGQMPAQGTCVNCGGTLNADGTCSQCGYNNVGQQPGGAATLPNLHQPGVQAPGVQTQAFAKTAADTQGPVTKEQQAAVADLLIQQGRHDEVSRMLLHPEEYTDLLEQVQGQDETQPPTVDPNVQASPWLPRQQRPRWLCRDRCRLRVLPE